MPRMMRVPSESPPPDKLGNLGRMACCLIAGGRLVYRGYPKEIWSAEQNAPEQWNLWRCRRLDNEVEYGLWIGDVEWELWWWGVWFGEPMQMDSSYVIDPQPGKDLLKGRVPMECSDEEFWKDRMQPYIKASKDSTRVHRGTGCNGHLTWTATNYKPDDWNLWHCSGDEPVEFGLWRCTTHWQMYWLGEWNDASVEELVE